MLSFFDNQHLGATCLAAITAAICHLAGMNDWRLIALPLLGVFTYYLILKGPRDVPAPAPAPRRAANRKRASEQRHRRQ